MYDERRETHISDDRVIESLEFVDEYAEGGAANQGSAETGDGSECCSNLLYFRVNRRVTHMSWLISAVVRA